MRILLSLIISLVFVESLQAQSIPPSRSCRTVDQSSHIAIDSAALQQLDRIGIDRNGVLLALQETSMPETRGCWSGASGNFDGQLVSIGIAQWNYGQGSLQPLLRKYKQSFTTQDRFESELETLMPKYGRTLFSKGCLQDDLTADCLAFLHGQQAGKGKLRDKFRAELDALFESDPMTQIQTDVYVRLLTSVVSDLNRIFPDQPKTPLRVKWAVDTKVQQGGFPGDADIKRIRDRWGKLSNEQKTAALANIFRWYDGLCSSIDQDGVRFDCNFNLTAWNLLNTRKQISEEASDLILLSHLKSRTAKNKAGLYQADSFQRRTKIALGVGSVHGRRDP